MFGCVVIEGLLMVYPGPCLLIQLVQFASCSCVSVSTVGNGDVRTFKKALPLNLAFGCTPTLSV